MKTLGTAILAAALTAGSVAATGSASAATNCGCPVVTHHHVHHPLRHRAVYRRARPPVEAYSEDAPIAERGTEPIYEAPAPVYYAPPTYPIGYAAPIGYGGYGYYGGPRWHGGWARGYGYHGYRYNGYGYRGWGGGHHWR